MEIRSFLLLATLSVGTLIGFLGLIEKYFLR